MRICGLDIHKRKIVAYILDVSVGDSGGSEIEAKTLHVRFFNRSLVGLGELVEFLKEYGVEKVVMESTGPYGVSVYYFLDSEGFDVYMVNARDNKSVNQKKTDRYDAERLARRFVAGTVRAYKLPSDRRVRDLRSLVRLRKKLVEQRASLKNMIIRIFDEACIDIKEAFSDIGKGALIFIDGYIKGRDLDDIIRRWPRLAKRRDVLRRIMSVKLSASSVLALKTILEILKKLDDEIDRLDRCIENILVGFREEVELLLTIPGVGIKAAAVILSEIGDIKRFSSPKKLASYAGVVPEVYQSGDKVVYGGLRKDCNKRLRWILYEVSLQAKESSPRLKEFYERLLSRGKAKKQAIVAVARKIIVAIWHILTRHVPWNEAVKKSIPTPKKHRVSRMTIREALEVLRNAGYIVIKP